MALSELNSTVLPALIRAVPHRRAHPFPRVGRYPTGWNRSWGTTRHLSVTDSAMTYLSGKGIP